VGFIPLVVKSVGKGKADKTKDPLRFISGSFSFLERTGERVSRLS